MTRDRIVRGLLGAAGFGALVLIVRRYGAHEVLGAFNDLRPGWFAVYAVNELAIFLAYAIRWRAMLAALGTRVSLRRLLSVRLAGLTVGSLTPGAKLGGEPLRAYLLAKDGVPVGAAIATVVLDRGLELLANIVFAVGYIAIFATRDRAMAGQMLVVIGLSGTAFAIGVIVFLRKLRRGAIVVPRPFVAVVERLGGSEGAILDTATAMRHLVFARSRLMMGCVAAALVANAMILLEYALLFRSFGADPSLAELAGVLMGVGFAHALPMPAAVGALEGTQLALFRMIGGSDRLGLIAAAVARVRDTVWTIPGALILLGSTVRRERS